jgi:allantoate deiminase
MTTTQMSLDCKARAEQAIDRCRTLAKFSEDAGATRRTFLSAPMRDCHAQIASWLAPSKIVPTIDAIGNLHAVAPSNDRQKPRLLIGSHLDTVPNAGALDGILGIMLGLSLLESSGALNLPFAIELVAFSEEEGVRFGVPFLGSLAAIGSLDENLLSLRDAQGISVREAITHFGLNPSEIPSAALPRDQILGYLEFHIEQGPVLEARNLPLGIVEAIVGQIRKEFVFTGRASHAGTTPMHLRHDALAAAAEWIVAIEREARSTPSLVATVGFIEAVPGAANVIPGEARLTLDLRHTSDDARLQAIEKLEALAREIANRRALSVSSRVLLDQKAVAMDPFLTREIENAVRSVGCEPRRMPSGAGHDAMILAEKFPSAMIFLRSPGGISHHPAESVLVDDVAKSLEAGMRLLENLAASPDFLKRTCRA